MTESNNSSRIIACISAHSKRRAILQALIRQLINKVDELHICLSSYNKVPNFLVQDKIHTYLRPEFTESPLPAILHGLQFCESCYYFVIEDSVLLPPDFIERTIQCLQKYNNQALLTGGGSILPETPKWYGIRCDSILIEQGLASDRLINLPNSSLLAFHTASFPINNADFNNQPAIHLSLDVEVALAAKKYKVPIVIPQRSQGWLTSLSDGHLITTEDNYDFSANIQAVATEGNWGFKNNALFTIPKLEKTFGILTDEVIKRNHLDGKYCLAAKQYRIPNNWSNASQIFSHTTELQLAQIKREIKQVKSKFQRPPQWPEETTKSSHAPENYRANLSSEKVVASVTSFPARAQSLKKTVKSVFNQVDRLYVYLNGYEEIPPYLKQQKITVFRSQDYKDLSATGKVYPLDQLSECYFFTLDDDIIYPTDYVEKMVAGIEKYQRRCAVTVHGSIFPPAPSIYFLRTAVFAFEHELINDKFVSLAGSGTFAFHTSTLQAQLADFIPYVAVDLILSLLARQQKVPIVSLTRKENWLIHQEELAETGLFELFLQKITVHTAMVRQVADFSAKHYSSFILPVIDELFLNHTDKELAQLKLDIDFINYTRKGKTPPDWRILTRQYKTTFRRVIKSLTKIADSQQQKLEKCPMDFTVRDDKREGSVLKEDHPLVYERTLWYQPAIPPFIPHTEQTTTQLKIGLIGSARLLKCLEFEAETFLLTELNWSSTIKHSTLDFVLVESVSESVTGDFRGAAYESTEKKEILANLIKSCQERSIPVVFWQTKSASYDSYFQGVINKFDHIFCMDSESVTNYSKKCPNVSLLPLAIQPAINNPFISHFTRKKYAINILYNFWSDIFFSQCDRALLEKLAPLGLNITDTAIRQWEKRLADSSNLSNYVRGFMQMADFWNLLKYTKFFLTMDHSNFSKCHLQQLALDAAAAGSLCLHLRDKSFAQKALNGIMTVCDNHDDLINYVTDYSDNELYRQSVAQHGWRQAHGENAYAHRLQKITEVLGLNYKWDEFPCCSMIAPTNKPDFISRIVENGQKQIYPNKELIIAVNSDEINIKALEQSYQQLDWLRFVHIPNEQPIGRALNVAAGLASGKYCFKIDDDDIYSSHYLQDSVYHLRSYAADAWGKPPGSWLYFESDKKLYFRETEADVYPCVAPNSKHFSHLDVNFGGNTLGYRKSVLLECPFPENCIGAADNEIQGKLGVKEKKMAFFDQTGVIIERRTDKTLHNWRVNDKLLQKSSTQCTKENPLSFALCEEKENGK